MKILVLGGDGFCGWPAALHLSDAGHEITIVDNLSRRRIDKELGTESLTPITSMQTRLATWHKISGKKMRFELLDIATDYEGLLRLVKKIKPDGVVHFAEQRSAPYSMKSSATKRYTVFNNTLGTHNLLAALVESGSQTHLIHLGTMGVYGYGQTGTAPIPEGYLSVKLDTPDGELEQEIVYPPKPGSVYHTSKVTDHVWFQFYARNDELRITDLHQGIVWGTQTPQTAQDEKLINRFDYDGDYGTVLNRFLMEAAIGYPLTIHGSGGQKRAFIHIRDMVRCIELAALNPPLKGERVKIFNQATETHRIKDLASMIAKLTGANIKHLPNPRVEAEENELDVANDQFMALGLNPTTLSKGLLEEVRGIAERYKNRIDKTKIPATSLWRQPAK